jgi:hypothetical protein
MNARTAGTVAVAAFAAAIVVGVLVLRRPAAPLPAPLLLWADPSGLAAEPAAEAPAPAPVKKAASSRPHTAFDRVVAALRGGDRAKIREALEELRIELVPPAVPDAGNAAILYRQAFKLYPDGMNDEETELFGRLGDGGALTADERAKLEAVLDRSREVRKLLHEAGDRPGCNFNLDYTQGPAMLMDHITGLIGSARLLALESLMSEGPAVTDTARALFRLSEAVADEPVLVSQLVRSVCHEIAIDSRQREFEGEMSPDRLRSLVASLAPESVRKGYEKTLLFELYSITKHVLDGGGVQPPESPLTAHDLAYFAETLSEYAGLVGRPYYEVRDDLQRLQAARLDGAPAWAEITRQVMPAMARVSERQARAEATLGTAQVAAALRLFRDAQGAYPAALDELRGILPGSPVDPFTGKPYLYRREGSGFVVYSVGSDGQDGGGVSSENDVLFKSPR